MLACPADTRRAGQIRRTPGCRRGFERHSPVVTQEDRTSRMLTSSAYPPLAELYELHVGRMVGLARLLTGDAAAAEDIAHDAFIKAASKMGTLRDPERLDTYLQRTVVNLCHSRGRRRALETAWLRRARPAADVAPQAPEIRDEVWKAVLALPDRQRAAVVLRFYEDQSEERVGQILNCSTKAVNALVDRAKQTLRDTLAEEDEG